MISSSQETPNFFHLLKTAASLSSFDLTCDSSQSTKRFGDEQLLLSPVRSQQLSNPNKRLIVGDDSWLKRAVSISSEASSPERQFERQEFFNSFRVPVKFCEESIVENKLEHFSRNAINFIASETLYENANDITVFDCRYLYEYECGHIEGATHLCNPLAVEQIFFKSIPVVKPIVVLYCEFSEKRSLRIYNQIRNQDRNLNDYPKLHYPDLYVLDKGFSSYCLQYPTTIEGKYVRMDDKGYANNYRDQKWENENQWNQLKMRQRMLK